jgi:hypothetical protein
MQRRRLIGVITGAALAVGVATVWAATPAETCQAGKNKAAGKLASCRHRAYAKYALTGDATKRDTNLARCVTRYTVKWQALEAKAVADGGACRTVGDEAGVETYVEDYTEAVAAELAGGPLDGGPHGWRLRTGLTTCWNDAGTQIPCAGTGQDGELQFGLSPFYLDLSDGTIIDTRTGLTWEKQSDDGSIHDRDNTYTWVNAFAKVTTLNATRFAGYADWRVPNVNELHSLVSYSTTNPATPLAFNFGCAPGCTVLTCSCSAPGLGFYWMSNTASPGYGDAWALRLSDGDLFTVTTAATYNVRAVRGGF